MTRSPQAPTERSNSEPDLTLDELVAVTGPTETWHGQCFGIVSAAAELLGPDAHAVYGHYLGPVSETGYWSEAIGRPFVQHGWVKLADGRVLDPTRWSFTDTAPELALIELGEPRIVELDEGGNRWRTTVRRPCPESDGALTVGLVLEPEARAWVSTLLPGDCMPEAVTIGQLAWLANLPYDELGRFAGALYQAIVDADSYGVAFIPTDNRRRAEREFGLELSPRAATGRVSSTKPNYQSLPRTEYRLPFVEPGEWYVHYLGPEEVLHAPRARKVRPDHD